MDKLRWCRNANCGRAVPANFQGQRQVEFCCAECAEMDGKPHEPHHSSGCDERWEARKDLSVKFARN